MKLLIDTHVLIWWTADFARIPADIRTMLADTANDVFVSAVTGWEIALKVCKGNLEFDQAFLADFDQGVMGLSFKPLVVNAAQAVAGAQLSSAHKDPFDRMLAGQALVEQMTIVTADPAFASFGVRIVW